MRWLSNRRLGTKPPAWANPILREASQGISNQGISNSLGIHRNHVTKWRHGFDANGSDGRTEHSREAVAGKERPHAVHRSTSELTKCLKQFVNTYNKGCGPFVETKRPLKLKRMIERANAFQNAQL
ncbi:MAG: transposase [Lentimonas sp.]|jgi:transposase